MAVQEARIRGRSQCFENDQEVCTVLPMLYKVDLPIVVANLKIGGREDAKPVVQMLVPSLLKGNEELFPPIIATLGQPLINPVIIGSAIVPSLPPLPLLTTTPPPPVVTTTEKEVRIAESPTVSPAPTSNTTTTTTTTTTPSAQVAPTEIVTTTAPTTTTTSTTTPNPNETLPVIVEIQESEAHEANPINNTENADAGIDVKPEEDLAVVVPPLTVGDPIHDEREKERQRENESEDELKHDLDQESVAKTEYETVEFIPNLVQPPGKANALEEDSDAQSNSVHAEYPHAAQSLQIPEEPPEE